MDFKQFSFWQTISKKEAKPTDLFIIFLYLAWIIVEFAKSFAEGKQSFAEA